VEVRIDVQAPKSKSQMLPCLSLPDAASDFGLFITQPRSPTEQGGVSIEENSNRTTAQKVHH
jgi:hypothetical protein